MAASISISKEVMDNIRADYGNDLASLSRDCESHIASAAKWALVGAGAVVGLATGIDGVEMPPSGVVDWVVTAAETAGGLTALGGFTINAFRTYFTGQAIREQPGYTVQ